MKYYRNPHYRKMVIMTDNKAWTCLEEVTVIPTADWNRLVELATLFRQQAEPMNSTKIVWEFDAIIASVNGGE